MIDSRPQTPTARPAASQAFGGFFRSLRKTRALSFVIAAGVAAYFVWSEGSGANFISTSAITLAVCAALVFCTRRLLFSTLLVAAMVALIVGGSTIKRSGERMVVHAYDLYFYFPTWTLIESLWASHRAFLIGLVLALIVTIALAAMSWRSEKPDVTRRFAAAAFAVFAIVATLAAHERIERRHTQFYWDDLFVSSFYSSWGEALQALWRGQLLEAASFSSAPPLAANSVCAPAQKPPNIILIHEESVVPPSLFPQLAYDKRLDGFFKSFDGANHKLRVETYGGASWLTEFSVMTGLSTRSFGGMKQFLQTYMVQRLKDTLPQALERCGYRNVLFYPMLKSFISTAPFYTSIGIREIFDAKDQKAPTASERDRFYFANALADMQTHFASSKAPLFTFVETMVTHWPYDITYAPNENVPGGGPGTNPEMHEYLRRIWLAKTDYEDLLTQLRTRFPTERFLIVHYGDHHPVATRTLLGFPEDAEAEDITQPANSPGYLTYFAVDGVNFRPQTSPAIDPTDVAYLSSLILYSAGLPLPDSYTERLRLMRVCGGKYYDCPDRDQILGFHRRLIDAGLLNPR